MTEDQKTYKEKIEKILDRVSNGEEIFPKPAAINPLHKAVKENGVKKTIVGIFNESLGDYTNLKESEAGYGDGRFFRVVIPSNYPQADKYWESLVPRIRNLGKTTLDPRGEANIILGSSGNGKEVLKIEIVRDSQSSEKPGIFLSWADHDTMTPEEGKGLLEKAGLGVETTVPVENGVVAFVEP